MPPRSKSKSSAAESSSSPMSESLPFSAPLERSLAGDRSAPEEFDTREVRHVEAPDLVARLNQTVGLMHSLFQDRDHLMHEIDVLKAELGVGKEMRVEKQILVNLQREKEAALYQWEREKSRFQQEQEEAQKTLDALLKKREEEQKTRLAREAEEQAAELKCSEEDHTRRLRLEREDLDRAKKLWAEEKADFAREQERFKKEREEMQKRLTVELDMQNKHARELADLNHQKELAVLRGELELERASKVKLEVSLKDAYGQIDRLSAQISTLSREALTSVSSSAMANRLEDIVSQIAGNPRKGKENN